MSVQDYGLRSAPSAQPRSGGAHDGSAPISRRYLDASRRPTRIAFGVLFVIYSSLATMIGFAGDIAPVVADWYIRVGAGLILALAIFWSEVQLAEPAPMYYTLVLALDAWYTRRFSGWLDVLLQAHVPEHVIMKPIILTVLPWIVAIIIARAGEELIFGKRRK